MKIINIVDSLAKVNFGIWNSAVSTAHILKQEYGVESELWYPKPENPVTDLTMYNDCTLREIGTFNFSDVITADTIIVSHGCWQLPTRLAYKLKKQFGVRWMYVPHGMLEPWSLQQKWLQKKVYFYLFERRYSKSATVVRAVGSPELENLKKIFAFLRLIPNGVEVENAAVDYKRKKSQYLFMARLHHKKGVIPLVRAWKKSVLHDSQNHCLIIAGPDDGELVALQEELRDAKNIEYRGAVYGNDKLSLLKESSFYVLPSFSEGFPTSVVEAMSYGLIPIISKGCNFPEVFDNKLAFNVLPIESDIVDSLNKSANLSSNQYCEQSKKCVDFIFEGYSLSSIAKQQFDLFNSLR